MLTSAKIRVNHKQTQDWSHQASEKKRNATAQTNNSNRCRLLYRRTITKLQKNEKQSSTLRKHIVTSKHI
jgi:hypothetical protein